MLGVINVDVFETSEVVELGSWFSLNLLFTFDLVHWPLNVLFTHRILQFHQQLSQCVCWFKICGNTILSKILTSFVPRTLLRLGSWQEFSLIFLSLMFPLFSLMFPPPFLNHCCVFLLNPPKSRRKWSQTGWGGGWPCHRHLAQLPQHHWMF